jgi:hypothetical protein
MDSLLAWLRLGANRILDLRSTAPRNSAEAPPDGDGLSWLPAQRGTNSKLVARGLEL